MYFLNNCFLLIDNSNEWICQLNELIKKKKIEKHLDSLLVIETFK